MSRPTSRKLTFLLVGLDMEHFGTTTKKKQHNDRASLLLHFQTWCKELMNSLPDISDCFEVTFIQKPRNQQKLDVFESIRINKLVAEININKTILPKYH